MKKKYTKAKVEIIPLKTEAVCGVTGTVEDFKPGEGDPDPGRPPKGNAKAFDGNGVNDFPFDSIPPTKE